MALWWTAALLAAAFGPGLAYGTAQSSPQAFASADELLLCLAVPETGQELELQECLSAEGQDNIQALWLFAGTPTEAGWAPLELQSANDTNESGHCVAPNFTEMTVALSQDACDPGWQWRLDDQFRLQLLAENAVWCLERSNGTAQGGIALAACTDSRSQTWLPVPKGPSNPNARLGEIGFPLRKKGRYLVDTAGRTVRIRGVNWYGAHMETRVNNGLDRQPLARTARLIRHLGFNSVRLNYAVEMLHDHRPVEAEFLAANPQLKNSTPLEVFDAVVRALTAEGLLVIINCHTSDYRWCCSLIDEQALWWNDRWSEKDWLDSLTSMARRYAANPRVIGFDPRNEPRPSMPDNFKDTTLVWWDTSVLGDCTDVSVHANQFPGLSLGWLSDGGICLPQHVADWRKAATQASYAVWHGNPDALLFVEGVGAAELTPNLKSPMPFEQSCLDDRVVWSVHDYNWFWKWLQLGELLTQGSSSLNQIFTTLGSIYEGQHTREFNSATFKDDRNRAWGFFLKEDRAPVWVGEFGSGGDPNDKFWRGFTEYAAMMDLDWSYWALDGIKYPAGATVDSSYMDGGQKLDTNPDEPLPKEIGEYYGLLLNDYKGARHVWKLADLIRLQAPVLSDEGRGVPEKCNFDAALQPVTGTGPHPQGFGSYLNKGVTVDCKEAPVGAGSSASGKGRALSEALETEAAAALWAISAKEAAPAADEETAASWTSSSNDELPDEAAAARRLPTELLLAEAASELRAEECSYPGSSRHITAAEREDAEKALQDAVRDPNPVEEALHSKSSKEASNRLQALLHPKIFSRQTYLTAAGIGVPCLFVAIMLMAHFAARPKTKDWRTPITLAEDTLKSLCSCIVDVKWRPPADPRMAAEATKAWRPLVGLFYAAVAAGMIAVAIWGFQATMRVRTGIQVTSCSVMTGVDWALNGDDFPHGFPGLLPTLTRIDTVIEAMTPDSVAWQLWLRLEDEMREMPSTVSAINQVLAALEGPAEQACPAFDPELVERAGLQVKWGLASTLTLGLRQIESAVPPVTGVLENFQHYLNDAQQAAQEARDIVLEQFRTFVDLSPLSSITDMVGVIFATLVMVFVLAVPEMISAAAAVCRFWRADCCRCKAKHLAEQPLWQRSFPLGRQRAALCAWTTGLVYGVVAISVSIWLRTAIQIGVDACVVLNDLSSSNLHQYSAALGLPRRDRDFAENAAHLLITQCLAEDAVTGGDLSQLVTFTTCPANGGKPVSHDIREALPFINQTLGARIADLRRLVGGGGTLAEDSAVQALVEGLRGANFANGTGGCSVDEASQCSAFRKAYAASTGAAGNSTEACSDAELRALPSSLAQALEERSTALDDKVVNVSQILLTDLWNEVSKDLLPEVSALVGSLDCRFVRQALSDTIDGACFQVVAGILQIHEALLVLGCLSIFLALMMYALWLRLVQFRRFKDEHEKGRERATNSGQPFDCSVLSRELATGSTSSGASSTTSTTWASGSSGLTAAQVELSLPSIAEDKA